VRITGTATDNAGIARVEVSVRNEAGQWFDGRNTTWVTAQTWNQAPWSGADTRNVAYDWRLVAIDHGRGYHVEVRSADVSNNLSPVRTTDFTVRNPVADGADPEITLTNPTGASQVTAGQSMAITGNATDDVGVVRTAYAVQRGDTGGQWMQQNGTWGATLAWIDTPPNPAGSPAVTFSAAFTPPAAGQYGVTAQAWDFAGKLDATRPFVQVTALAADTTGPNGTLTSPTRNQAVPLAAAITFAGSGTDDRGVASVDVAVKNNTTGKWLRNDGTWGVFQWLPTVLGTPGATSTGWTYSWAPPGTGAFTVQVRTRDTAGNVDPVLPNVPFTVI
jgi:hypothetical protein